MLTRHKRSSRDPSNHLLQILVRARFDLMLLTPHLVNYPSFSIFHWLVWPILIAGVQLGGVQKEYCRTL